MLRGNQRLRPIQLNWLEILRAVNFLEQFYSQSTTIYMELKLNDCTMYKVHACIGALQAFVELGKISRTGFTTFAISNINIKVYEMGTPLDALTFTFFIDVLRRPLYFCVLRRCYYCVFTYFHISFFF